MASRLEHPEKAMTSTETPLLPLQSRQQNRAFTEKVWRRGCVNDP